MIASMMYRLCCK